ncbi:MAG: hypothetical protein KG003_13970 [Bacteroidetes bacterium]|nr:hypothetical protein [Bacteroidota bacterium]
MENLENNTNLETSAGAETENVPSTGKAVFFDGQAIQKVPVWLDEEDTEPVILTFEPLSDARYLEFAANSKLKIVDDGNAIAQAKSQALGKLWNNLVSEVENVEWEDGRKPENWKDAFDLLQFKIPTMNRFLAVVAYEKPKTSNGKVVFSVANERIIYADLYFNGEVVTTVHYLQKSNFEFAKELENSQKMPFGNKAKGLQEIGDYALPNSVEGKAALYDKMKTREAEGFNGKFVPVRVKEEIIDFIAKAIIKQKK